MSRILQLAPGLILEDPVRFQSRAEYPRDFRESDLNDVSGFNRDFAGLISVWEDTGDKKTYVIDGHRRLRLAQRVKAPFVDVQVLEVAREADGLRMRVKALFGNRQDAGKQAKKKS